MRSSAVLFMSLAMAVGAVCLAFAAPGSGQPGTMVELENVSGAVSIANSRDGQALFSATGLRPGGSASGTVTIGNSGDIAGDFVVRTTGLVDTPGPAGGLLSERLQLEVLDVTGQPEVVFAGTPAEFGEIDLGTLAPGEERDYQFTALLPHGGAADNDFQGAALSLGFAWEAGTAGVSTPTPTVTPTPTPTVTPTPTAKPKPKPTATPTKPTATPTPVPVDMATVLGLPAASKCLKGGKLKFKLKAPVGTKIVSATVAVNGKVKARLKGKKVRKAVTLKRLRKTVKVTVSAKGSDRRVYVGTRVYVSCKR